MILKFSLADLEFSLYEGSNSKNNESTSPEICESKFTFFDADDKSANQSESKILILQKSHQFQMRPVWFNLLMYLGTISETGSNVGFLKQLINDFQFTKKDTAGFCMS